MKFISVICPSYILQVIKPYSKLIRDICGLLLLNDPKTKAVDNLIDDQ